MTRLKPRLPGPREVAGLIVHVTLDVVNRHLHRLPHALEMREAARIQVQSLVQQAVSTPHSLEGLVTQIIAILAANWTMTGRPMPPAVARQVRKRLTRLLTHTKRPAEEAGGGDP